MATYLFRLLDMEGQAHEDISTECADDFAALDEARALTAGWDIEIWRDGKLLTRMHADGEAALEAMNRTATAASA